MQLSPRSISSAWNPLLHSWRETKQRIIHLISDAQTSPLILFDCALVLSQCHGQGLTQAICQSEQRRQDCRERADASVSAAAHIDPAKHCSRSALVNGEEWAQWPERPFWDMMFDDVIWSGSAEMFNAGIRVGWQGMMCRWPRNMTTDSMP